jgi:hypothetical protein
MGIQRLDHAVAWQIDDYEELADIADGELRHGDDAFIVNDDAWYKYNKVYGTWQLISTPEEL